MTIQVKSCTLEKTFRKSHVITYIMSSIDPIYQEYPLGNFITYVIPGSNS